jgi:glucosamine-6-phosphate deaminase
VRLITPATVAEFDSLAAEIVTRQVRAKPAAAVALPAGSTPLGLYAQLRARAPADRKRLDEVRFFNLDEYVAFSAEDSLSFAHFLNRELFGPLGIARANLRLLHGDATDPDDECADYETALADAGGLDLAILGLGANEHIAFNEPGTPWTSVTHVARLAPETLASQAHLFRHARVTPERGLTMGIATILRARAILLLVAGESKRTALTVLLRGIADVTWPATSLYDHPALTVLCAPEVVASESVREAMRRSRAERKKFMTTTQYNFGRTVW